MRLVILGGAFLSVIFISATVYAEDAPSGFDAAMQPILAEYLKISEALSADKLEGVTEAAKNIEQLSGALDPSLDKSTFADLNKNLPSQIKSAAMNLSNRSDIKSSRTAFKELSKPVVAWASRTKPLGINGFLCPMAEASWLQADSTVHNPYYGAEMPTCGQLVFGPSKVAPTKKAHKSGSGMKSHGSDHDSGGGPCH